MAKYNIIVADPPWTYNDKLDPSRTLKYPILTHEDIKRLNVQSITANDCVLFLWGTWPLIQECLDTIQAWGFVYKTLGFNWVKKNKIKDSWFWGMGNWSRSGSEFCLLATKGKPKRSSASVHSTIASSIGPHSKKPDIVMESIVRLCGDLPRVELFARQRLEGWDAIGLDIDGQDIRDVL